jgi:hypothetical protein
VAPATRARSIEAGARLAALAAAGPAPARRHLHDQGLRVETEARNLELGDSEQVPQ